ncbi:MFS transporter [Massilia endophytica]|uniref:MFS transporter n=1 Tax=Massilia endophytica TaxID=2899220 RepID=UPI001E405D92|nr:MFS transporter [Massilia endophytica]UGQ45673.1 MFS transporter [Massilia endophytica]
MSPQHRLAFPLASLTAVGLLASDLYLPALPAMQQQLGASVTAAQATMAVFMLALAASQLVWGWAADRFGDLATILSGTALLAVGSLLCAMAGDIDTMLAGRLLQGLGAGAATVAVPALIRRRFSETEAVGAMAVVAMAESVIPALGPVAGAALVMLADWRYAFWIIAALALLLAPMVTRIISSHAVHAVPAASPAAPRGLLRNLPFLRYAFSYALMFGALLMFVASAPYLVTHWLGREVSAFALLQICGVGCFMVGATRGARAVERYGVEGMVRLGVLMQAASGIAMTALALADLRSTAALTAAWALFCCGLGVRGPSTMSRALSLAHEHAGKAAGLLMFLAFAATSGATMAAAPLLERGLLPVALLLTVLVLLSAALVPGALRRPAGEIQKP